MRGLLNRPGDTPSEREEATISRMAETRQRDLAECKTAIARAHARQTAYLATGKLRDAEIQGDVKDRRLRELNSLMTASERTAADQRVAEKWS